jgi:hypothetical protein
MSKDITNDFQLYRESLRHLWNTYFVPRVQKAGTFDQKWDLVDQFRQVNVLLLKSLVLNMLDIHACEIDPKKDCFHLLSVVPDSAEEVPIMINRPSSDGNKYWDDSITRVRAADIALEFLECFDWNQVASRDFVYYRVKIRSFPKHPNLVGREALLESRHCRVLIDESDTNADIA